MFDLLFTLICLAHRTLAQEGMLASLAYLMESSYASLTFLFIRQSNLHYNI